MATFSIMYKWSLGLFFNSIETRKNSLCDKQNEFHFTMVHFPFVSTNIPQPLTHEAYVSQLIRHAGACSEYNIMNDYVM